MKKYIIFSFFLVMSFTFSKISFGKNFSNSNPMVLNSKRSDLMKKNLVLFDHCREAALWGYNQTINVCNQGFSYCMTTTGNLSSCTTNWYITVHNTLMEALYADLAECEQYGGGQL